MSGKHGTARQATDIHSECVTFMTLPQQQWSHERASILRLYLQCLSCCILSMVTKN